MAKHSRNDKIVNIKDVKDAKDKKYANKVSSSYDANNRYDNLNDYYKAKHADPLDSTNDEQQLHDEEQHKSVNKNANFLKLSIVVVMILIIALFGILLSDIFVVDTINVSGNEIFYYYDVIELSEIKYKQSIFDIDIKETIKNMETQKPMIKVKSIKKVFPNRIDIIIEERKPVCYIILYGSEKRVIIGENNICLDILDDYNENKIPLINGLELSSNILGDEIESDEIAKLKTLCEITYAMAEINCIEELESINIINTTNITMKSRSGTFIRIGDTTNVLSKFKSVKRMLKLLKQEGKQKSNLVITGDGSSYVEEIP